VNQTGSLSSEPPRYEASEPAEPPAPPPPPPPPAPAAAPADAESFWSKVKRGLKGGG
jgi:hypothetical protein